MIDDIDRLSGQFCLGSGNPKCSECQHDQTWMRLNDLPDATRLATQATMVRINDDICRLNGLKYFKLMKNR